MKEEKRERERQERERQERERQEREDPRRPAGGANRSDQSDLFASDMEAFRS